MRVRACYNARMPSPRTKPSRTSLVAFVLIVTPLVYVLSYAPVVRVCGRTAEVPFTVRDRISVSYSLPETYTLKPADASLYPTYQPVDWLIDNTPLRQPLFYWAEIWGVRNQFQAGVSFRSLDAL